MRNTRAATAVAAFSKRAKPNASVSVPVTWEEIDILTSSDSTHLQSVIRRLGQLLVDPWSGIDEVEQGSTQHVRKALDRMSWRWIMDACIKLLFT